MNKDFTNLTKTLKLKKAPPAQKNKNLKYLLQQFKNRSIKKTQKHLNSKEKFTFREFHQDEIIKIIKELTKNKASTFRDISVNMIYTFSLCLVLCL